MDADLSRRAGRAKNTPYYRYIQSEDVDAFDQQFNQILIEAGTFENLKPETQQFLRLCERSYEIAQDMKITDWVNPDNLQKIIDQLVAEIPADEVEV